jgi:predicted tellurium resistance membrane protein TerC
LLTTIKVAAIALLVFLGVWLMVMNRLSFGISRGLLTTIEVAAIVLLILGGAWLTFRKHRRDRST